MSSRGSSVFTRSMSALHISYVDIRAELNSNGYHGLDVF